jgi:hypothetical protein
MSPRDGAAVDDVVAGLVDDVDERFDRAMALLRADQIIRDIDRLQRAWRRYVRQHPPSFPGQLDLF